MELIVLAAAVAAASPAPEAVAAAPVAVEAAAAPSAESDVTSYPPSFFAQSRPTTASEMVSRVPGFTVDSGQQARGLSGTAGNVLINGERPSSKTDTASAVLQRIPADQVIRIDLIRGGAPGIDMQGRAVVVNVIAKQTSRYSGSATLGVDRIFTRDETKGSVNLIGAVKLTARQSIDGQFTYQTGPGGMGGGGGGGGGGNFSPPANISTGRIRLDPTGTSTINSATFNRGSSTDTSGQIGYDFGLLAGQGSTGVQLFKSDQNGADTEIYRFPMTTPTRYATSAGKRTGGEWDGTYTYPFNDKTSLELTGLKSWRDNDSLTTSKSGTSTSTNTRKEKSGETVGQLTLNIRPFTDISFVNTAEAAYNFLDGSSIVATNGVVSSAPNQANKVEEKRGEVSSVATWQADRSLTYEAGLRYEFSTLSASGKETSLRYLKPSLQMAWRINPQTQLRARLERTVGQLDFSDFVATTSFGTGVTTAGAVDLVPSQDTALSIQFDRQFWQRGSFRLIARIDQLNDVNDRVRILTTVPRNPVPAGCPAAGPATCNEAYDGEGNIGDGKKGSLQANLNLPLDRLYVKGGRLVLDGTWRFLSQVVDPFTGETRRISSDRDHNYGVQFSQDISAWRTTWGFNINKQSVSYSYRRDGRDIQTGKPQFGAYITYNPSSKTSWRLDARNLNGGGFTTTREVYPGQRNLTALSYTETRVQKSARSLRLTLRRAL